jgi:hypothetical protein
VLYGYEAWTHTEGGTYRQRVFKNIVVRKIFGPKRGWIRLHIEKLYDLYSSPNIIQVIKSSSMR